MTSSSDGENGLSYGWINHDLIGSGEIKKQINAVGGEERFWLGPEGGQFSIFFKKIRLLKYLKNLVIELNTYTLIAIVLRERIYITAMPKIQMNLI